MSVAHLTDCERSLRVNCELCQVDAKLYNMNISARTKSEFIGAQKAIGGNHIKSQDMVGMKKFTDNKKLFPQCRITRDVKKI